MTDLPFILQERSSQMDFDVVEYRGMATKAIDKRIKFTIQNITEWSPFRCAVCFGKDGSKGHIGKNVCKTCNGLGYFTMSVKH
jgi:DnaJ-class molecular chaperone